MAKLYDIAGEFAVLAARLESCEDDAEMEAILQQMDAIDASLRDTADAYARAMKNAQAEADGLAAEIRRLTDRKRACDNRVNRIKTHIQNALTLAGVRGIATGIGKWSIAPSNYSVNVVDVSRVPERFLIPQPPLVDKRTILNEFRETGEFFDGVDIVRGESVRFR